MPEKVAEDRTNQTVGASKFRRHVALHSSGRLQGLNLADAIANRKEDTVDLRVLVCVGKSVSTCVLRSLRAYR
jgi:hypothetical protein